MLAAIYSLAALAGNSATEISTGEIIRQDLASWNSRTVQLPDGRMQAEFRGGWVNYLAEDGIWKPINYEFEKTEDGWVAKDAPFTAVAPLRSDGTAYFISNNRWDIFSNTPIDSPEITQTIEALNVKPVKGRKETGDLGFGETTYIIYENAYPELDADLIYWLRQGIAPRLDKLVRFNSALKNDVKLDFRIKYLTEAGGTEIKSIEGMWNKSSTLKTEGAISVKPEGEEGRRGIGLETISIWDAHRRKVEEASVELRSVGEEEYVLTKTIPSSFFNGTELPVYTDTEETFYPEPNPATIAGDGSADRISDPPND